MKETIIVLIFFLSNWVSRYSTQRQGVPRDMCHFGGNFHELEWAEFKLMKLHLKKKNFIRKCLKTYHSLGLYMS